MLLTIVLAAVAGCGEAPASTPGSPGPPADPARVIGWERILIDEPVLGIHAVDSLTPQVDVLATGVREGGTFLVSVPSDEPPDSSLQQPGDALGPEGPSQLDSDGLNHLVTGPGPDGAAALWIGGLDLIETWRTPPSPEEGELVWFRAHFDGEQNLRGAGVVHDRGQWWLRGWQLWNDWEPLDEAPRLVVDGPRPALHTAVTETALVVAGEVAARDDGRDAELSIWELADHAPGDGGTRWARRPLATPPDAITDLVAWELGFWVAGHRDGRAVLLDFDEHDGEPMSVPEAPLSGDRPQVLVASKPVGDRPTVLAMQHEDGPSVWIQDGVTWADVPAPVGTLQDAAAVGDRLYVLVDGVLWRRPAPEGLLAQSSLG